MKRKAVYYKEGGKLRRSRQVKTIVESDVVSEIMSHVPVYILDAVSDIETVNLRFVEQSLWNAINWSQNEDGN